MPVLYQLVYFSAAFLNVILASLIFIQRPKDKIVKVFAAFFSVIAGWIITLYFYNIFTGSVAVIFVGRLNYVFAELIAYFAFLFVYLFPKKTVILPSWLHYALGVFVTILVYITLATDLVDQTELIHGVARETIYGPIFPLFITQFVGLFFASVVLLVVKYHMLRDAHRTAIRIFTLGLVLAIGFGIVTNILMPLLLSGNNDIANLGPIDSLILLGATGYLVAKHALLDIKVLATEAIIAFLLLLFVMNAAIAVSYVSMFLSIVSFVAAALLGAGLIRSVRAEVHEREQLQSMAKDLATANAHLRQMDEAKSEFLSIASHELRTPVSVIKGYISLMLEDAYGKVPEPVKEKLRHMFEMNERLVHIINNLLNTSRIEKNRLEFVMKDLDPVRLADAAVDELRNRAAEKHVDLVLETPPKNVPTVMVDEEKVHEVFVNLIDNAIKYSPEHTTITVSIDPRAAHGFVKVRVADTGIGMTEATKNRLFQRYYRAPDPKTRHQKGTGLGLYICKRFIEGMGGNIEVERTEEGKGTTIAFTLPLTSL